MGLNEAAGYGALAATVAATGWSAANHGLRPEPFLLGAADIAIRVGLFRCVRQRLAITPYQAAYHTTLAPFAHVETGSRRGGVAGPQPPDHQSGRVGQQPQRRSCLGLLPILFAAEGLSVTEIGLLAAPLPGGRPPSVCTASGDSGYAIGALIASIIADVVGLRGAILTVAALTAASGLIAARLLTETNIPGETTMARTKVNHPLFARFYAWVSPRMEKVGYGERRGQLLAGLTGRVLEVGAGNGLNFAHYPPEVTGVLAVEPEPHLRALAETRASETAIPIEVVDGTADQLPEADASFDAVVASLVLCSVPDVPAALTEIRRVVKPGGELRFFEHVRADTPGLARVQRVLDATVWPTFGGGCHAHRDTRTAIEAAGFTITGLEQLRIPETGIPGPTSPHIIGAATTKEG